MRATTKKVVNFFEEEKCTPDKILVMPMATGVNVGSVILIDPTRPARIPVPVAYLYDYH